MQHVKSPQAAPEPRLRLGVMQIIMHHVVDEIAEHESHQPRIGQRKPEEHAADENGRQHDRRTQQRRHHEAQGVARMIVMNAMDQQMNAGAPGAGEFGVEEIAVAEIFDERPNHIAEQCHADDRCRPERIEAQPRQQRHEGHVEDQRHRPMHPRQFVEQGILEESRRSAQGPGIRRLETARIGILVFARRHLWSVLWLGGHI